MPEGVGGNPPSLIQPDGTWPIEVKSARPRFCLFIDTEEEFDWSAPFRREAAVKAIAALPDAQARFTAAGIAPTYLVTYPVVDQASSGAIIRALATSGQATVGAQLHAWVTPPFEEPLSRANSFAGNLPRDLEAAKLRTLTSRIEEVTSRKPAIFRAGRYGVGPNTAATLLEQGYTLDVSIRPLFNYAAEAGPDFSRFGSAPFRTGPGGALLALPLGVADLGWARGLSFRLPTSLRRLAHRIRAHHRVPLTPEGTTAREAIRAVDRLLADGINLLSLSFHSPSLVAGHTPYVRDHADIARFWRWWDIVLDHLARRGAEPIGGDALIDLLDRAERLPARGAVR